MPSVIRRISQNARREQTWSAVPSIATVKVGMLVPHRCARNRPAEIVGKVRKEINAGLADPRFEHPIERIPMSTRQLTGKLAVRGLVNDSCPFHISARLR